MGNLWRVMRTEFTCAVPTGVWVRAAAGEVPSLPTPGSPDPETEEAIGCALARRKRSHLRGFAGPELCGGRRSGPADGGWQLTLRSERETEESLTFDPCYSAAALLNWKYLSVCARGVGLLAITALSGGHSTVILRLSSALSPCCSACSLQLSPAHSYAPACGLCVILCITMVPPPF